MYNESENLQFFKEGVGACIDVLLEQECNTLKNSMLLDAENLLKRIYNCARREDENITTYEDLYTQYTKTKQNI